MARPFVSTPRPVFRTGLLLAALHLLGTSSRAQTPQTFNACYVPSVGAIYLVGLTGLPGACLGPTHVAVSWAQGGTLGDGSVTTAKLADGAVTTAKIAPGTSVDFLGALAPGDVALASHNHNTVYAALSHSHDNAYPTRPELSDVGTINATSNPVDWTRLKGVPAGLADGVDDAGTTTFTASTPIQIAGTNISLSSTGCVAGEMWKWTGAVWSCDPDANSGGTVTSITAGTGLAGGAITTSGTVSVSFAGPGAATTVARSDHAHEAAGSFNTAVGEDALFGNTGPANTAVGDAALVLNSSGANNTALGTDALHNNTTGSENTALGKSALVQSTGTGNIAVGFSAGFNLVSGGFNIYLQSLGANSESGTIRIGTSPTHGRAFIAGIRGVTTGAANAVAVVIDANGQLGTVSSSRRFKEDIRDMGEASRDLLLLRPVAFRYRQPAADGSQALEYGLIAEEVEEVFPELVAYGSDGQVETVRYHVLPVLLVNELQRQERELAALRQMVEELRAELRRIRR